MSLNLRSWFTERERKDLDHTKLSCVRLLLSWTASARLCIGLMRLGARVGGGKGWLVIYWSVCVCVAGRCLRVLWGLVMKGLLDGRGEEFAGHLV